MFRGTPHNFFLSHQDLRPHQTPSKHALKIACRPILLYFALLLKPGPSLKGSYLRCMKTHINIKRQSSAVTTLHEDKLRSRLQEAMLTYSTPHLWLSCLDYAVSWEVVFHCTTTIAHQVRFFNILLNPYDCAFELLNVITVQCSVCQSTMYSCFLTHSLLRTTSHLKTNWRYLTT